MQNNNRISPLILTAFILSFLYWIYLSFICQMYLWHDAIGYEYLGELLYKKGWLAYFKTGPNREPIYPYLISLSMHLADHFSTSYKTIQIFIQILILFGTQILTYLLLKKAKIHTYITAITLLYLGFSPAMFISTFRLYSEIAAYPFVLLIIFFSIHTWHNIHTTHPKKYKPLILSSLFLGLSFLGAVFVKGIFELIFPIYIFPFILFAILTFIQNNKKHTTQTFISILILLLSFYIPLNAYKLANKTYNGNFTLTDRGPWALYGNTARRMEPLTMKRFLMAVTYVPRPESCYALFGKEDCQVWHYSESDKFGFTKLAELKHTNLSSKEIDKKLVHLSIKKILENPFQYGLFWMLEGTKLFFWEFTSMAYVVYPDWMIKLFYYKPFYLGLNALMTLLSFLAFIHLAIFNWHHKKNIFTIDTTPTEPTIFAFSVFILISAYMAIHCFFFVLPRYVFPIVPLYLISIAFLWQRLTIKIHAKT